MAQHDWKWQFTMLLMVFAAGLGACVAVVAWPLVGWSFTNDISHAKCTPNLTCQAGPCLLVWRPWSDPPCALQRACVSFQAQAGIGGTFKECTWSNIASDWCYSGHDEPPPPTVATCGGQYWFCNCRDQIQGDCNASNTPSGTPPGICNCMSFGGTSGTHNVTGLCT